MIQIVSYSSQIHIDFFFYYVIHLQKKKRYYENTYRFKKFITKRVDLLCYGFMYVFVSNTIYLI